MKLRVSVTQQQKQTLSTTLRSWLPILQSDLDALPEALEPFVQANPFIQVRLGHEKLDHKFAKKGFFSEFEKNSVSETIEALTFSKKSLYDMLFEQINPPLFPTPLSQEIAYEIIENLSCEGYIEAKDIEKIAQKLDTNTDNINKIRKRFSHLEPVGIAALDYKEAFLFQLDDMEIDDVIYGLAKKLIINFESIELYSKDEYFGEALAVIRKFRNPPAIDFFEQQKQIIPDIFVFDQDGRIEIVLNDAYYPEIIIDTEGLDETQEFVKEKIKDAKDLVDALDMRKATLYKIGLMIVEYQYDFFFGKAIRPMKLKDLADDLQRNPSTISRAISGKYLSCSRGIIALKHFFATALEENLSNSAIKDYMLELVKYEDYKKPLSDIKILDFVEKKFGIKMVRRTITKYRKEFNIAGSSERKKLYSLKMPSKQP